MRGLRAGVPARARDPQSGLTLLETLVTLVIVGAMAGLVTLGAGRLAAPELARTEALRLARVLDGLADDALATGTDRVVLVTPGGYRADGLDPRPLPQGVTLARTDGAGPSIRLSGHGVAAAATLQVADGAALWVVSFDGLRARVVPGVPGLAGAQP